MIDLLFVLNSILLGTGLAMDAFSVSIGNGLAEPDMKHGRMGLMAGCYAFFQFLMPMIGWALVHTIITFFNGLTKAIPWIALILLLFIGGKMIFESAKEIAQSKKKASSCDASPGGESSDEKEKSIVKKLSFTMLLLQGIATSIDALSVGLAISEYHILAALVASVIIAVVTFIICLVGLKIGKMVGKKLGVYAGILGGVILVGIGIEIFVKGMFF